MLEKSMMALLALAAVTAMVPAASAANFNSAYTDINLDDCTIMEADDFGASWACPGYKGYPLYIAEGDLRFMVSYGFGAKEEPAASQTPPPFNYLGPNLEWRLSNASGGFKPVATILRYFLQGGDGDKEAQILVVTQLAPGQTCHIGYVDALANADANDLARQIADRAGSFDCAKDAIEFSPEFAAWPR